VPLTFRESTGNIEIRPKSATISGAAKRFYVRHGKNKGGFLHLGHISKLVTK
jgi:hypothetical protein